MQNAISQRVPARITTTTLMKTGPGSTSGFICSTSTMGTVTIYDGIDNTGKLVIDAMPVTAGQWYPADYKFGIGMYVVIGGTADVTFFI